MEINFSLKSLTKIRKVRRINNPLVSLVHWGWKYICRKYKISARSTRRSEAKVKIEVDDPQLCRDEGWILSVRPSVCPSVYLSKKGWEGDDNGVVTARREYPGGRDNFNDKTERGIACNFEISKCRMGRNALSSFFDRCVEFWKVKRWKRREEYKKVNAGFFFSSDIDTFPFFFFFSFK